VFVISPDNLALYNTHIVCHFIGIRESILITDLSLQRGSSIYPNHFFKHDLKKFIFLYIYTGASVFNIFSDQEFSKKLKTYPKAIIEQPNRQKAFSQKRSNDKE